MGGEEGGCYVCTMSWFDRCCGDDDPAEAWDRLNAAVTRSGVDAALAAAAGRRGLRCFVVRFELRGGRARVTELLSEPLRQGGGPPPPAAFDQAVPAIEAGLAALRKALPPRFAFERGAVAFVRDGKGVVDLRFRFDEDADTFGLAEVKSPGGEPHPVEEPAYLRALRQWESGLARVRARWEVGRDDEPWRFTGGKLHVGGATPRPGEALATWTPKNERFEWLLGEPAGEEAPFVEPVLSLTLSEAVEVVALAAARRRDHSVFQGVIDDGTVVFVAVRA